jgi:GxxExxY protein
VIYKGIAIKGQRMDLLVENEVIIEIKSLAKLPEVATAQTLSYLKATALNGHCSLTLEKNVWWKE